MMVKVPDPHDPLADMVRLAQIGQARQQQQLSAYKLLEAQEQQQGGVALKHAFTRYQGQDLSDPGVQSKMLSEIRHPGAYGTLSAVLSTQNKAMAHTQRAYLEMCRKKLEMGLSILDHVTPATHQAYRELALEQLRSGRCREHSRPPPQLNRPGVRRRTASSQSAPRTKTS